ncbi:zinc transporter ZntB, partial [Thioclava sp. BHET1]
MSWLDPLALRALLAEETRPRATPTGEGVLVVLRGVNMNPGEDPEDMVSLRLYVDQARIVSVAVRDLMSVADLRDQVAAGQGPEKAGVFLCRLIERLNDRIESVIHSIDEECDAIEEALIDGGQDSALRSRIAQGRRQVILL